MYDTILVPTDGSAPADAALDHAIDLAAACGATVHVLYVVDLPALRAARMDTDAIREDYEEEGHAIVERGTKRATEAGVTAVRAVETDVPADVVLDYATDHDVDLIVMGTHGRTGLERFLLGSVTERVLRTASIPVLTIHDGERSPPE